MGTVDRQNTGPRDETAAVREAIAQALWVADEGPKRADEWWDAGEYEAVRAACYKRADAVLDALGIERLGIMVGSGGPQPDRPAWGHRWTIGDRVVSVDHEHRWDRDVPLFRIRALEQFGSTEGAGVER